MRPVPYLGGVPSAVVVFFLGCGGPLGAAPADLPRYDVERSCAAFVGTNDPTAPMRNLCIQREQQGYDLAVKLWPAASVEERAKCTGLAERSRSYKYVYLATCLRSTGRSRELSTPKQFRY